MELFLTNIISFPVAVYTLLMIIVMFYWLLALIGAVDIELFDIDIDFDMDVETELDAPGLGGVAGIMSKLGLTGVPVTVVISILVAFSWLICYLLTSLVLPLIPWNWASTVLGIVALVGSFLLAIPATALLVNPMKGMFVNHDAVQKSSLIGRECLVRTGKVTSTFGQAELEDGGAGMLFDVRADEAYGIQKGDVVILVSYNIEDDSYQVTKAGQA
ncbi:OB-fold-containig protein [Marinicella sediminis]|uniref:OB-fold-containig protein n=1 Tax=Marinicella sediminis TaxID=1792834 RepID=A0ABV7JGQ8_9GAMM|nr:OB-fold-containig protein [Marinicella sediminis]